MPILCFGETEERDCRREEGGGSGVVDGDSSLLLYLLSGPQHPPLEASGVGETPIVTVGPFLGRVRSTSQRLLLEISMETPLCTKEVKMSLESRLGKRNRNPTSR